MEGVELEFKPSALTAVAKKAIKRKTGARGLRAIIEGCLSELMYDIPDRTDVEKVIIDDTVVTDGKKPKLVLSEGTKKKDGKSKEVVKSA